MVNKCPGKKDMNLGNVILPLLLQAKNLAASLEKDPCFSLPTYNPLPSSTESSLKYLLYATPPSPGAETPQPPFRLSASHAWITIRAS